jgi:predicted RNase H-like HicB family nuclease
MRTRKREVLPGCHTYGRTIEVARRGSRDALATAVDGADTAALAG